MFSKLIGNENVKLTLRRLIERGRIPNSLLLVGDQGVGKLQFALELARSYLCTEPVADEACGVCAACVRVDEFVIPEPTDKTKEEFKRVFFGGHSDVGKVVAYKRMILVDAIRDLERNANYLPYEGRARFFIIDDADKMNDQAANALLKTLEEPPPTSHILLIASRPDSLLPTIRSRCQTIRFSPVPITEIEHFLIAERAYTHDEAQLAARLSRGSIGRAVSINVEKFKKLRERMLAVVKNAIMTERIAPQIRIAEEMNDAKNKDSFEESLDILQSLIHDVWSLAVSGEVARIANSDLASELSELGTRAHAPRLAMWLAEIDSLRENLIVNLNRKVAADALFVTMSG